MSSILSRTVRGLLSRVPDATLADLGLRRAGTSAVTALFWAGVGASCALATRATIGYFASKRGRVEPTVAVATEEGSDASEAAMEMVAEGSPVHPNPADRDAARVRTTLSHGKTRSPADRARKAGEHMSSGIGGSERSARARVVIGRPPTPIE